MSDLYQVNFQPDIPIYRQLVDIIRSNIKSGKMPPGTRLPTVRDLANKLGIARGTIKRSYDELEKERLVEKVQGRGTFVSYRPENSESRKERAMAAIDRLLDELEELDFSMTEMNIFINLKLQERAAYQPNLKVAVIECNPEILFQLREQLRQIEKIDVYTYLLEDVLTYPYKIGEDMDLVVTTLEHAKAIEEAIPDSKKITKIALTPHSNCVAKIVKLKSNERIGILSHSARFGELLSKICNEFTEQVAIAPPCLLSDDVESYLADKTAILLPENYERYADDDKIKIIQEFSSNGQIITCAYRVDEGSLMYLQEKIQRLLEKGKL